MNNNRTTMQLTKVKELMGIVAAAGVFVGLILLFQYCMSESVPFPISDFAALGIVGFSGIFFVTLLIAILAMPLASFSRCISAIRLFYPSEGAVSRSVRYYLFAPGFAQLLAAIVVLGNIYDVPVLSAASISLFTLYVVLIAIGSRYLRTGPLRHRYLLIVWLVYFVWALFVLFVVAVVMERVFFKSAQWESAAVIALALITLLTLGFSHFRIYLASTSAENGRVIMFVLLVMLMLILLPESARLITSAGLRMLGAGGGREVAVLLNRRNIDNDQVVIRGALALNLGTTIYVKNDAGTIGIPEGQIVKITYPKK